jgi:hypothetical protein
VRAHDELVEILAEEYVASAVSGDDVAENVRDGDELSALDDAVHIEEVLEDDVSLGEKEPSKRHHDAARGTNGATPRPPKGGARRPSAAK